MTFELLRGNYQLVATVMRIADSQGHVIHSAVHATRPDGGCVIQRISAVGIAISAIDGTLLVSQHSNLSRA